MALTRAQKETLLADLTEIVKKAASMVFVHVTKTSVPLVQDLRRKLRADGAGYQVAKKTILKKALESAGITGELPSLDGQVAIAYGSDILTPAREISAFRKGKEDNVTLLGGVIEGAYMDTAKVMELASIPPLQTLRGMFVNIINSPIQRFVIALDQIAQKKA